MNVQSHKMTMVDESCALPGRNTTMAITNCHDVNGNPLLPPFPEGFKQAVFGMGCFWGAERIFWQQPGVYTTAAGYSGGFTPNPTYEEVCTGKTGHTEVVLVIYDPEKMAYEQLLKLFWESHNPTQGMRQGYDRGTQYRSAIYCFDEQQFFLATESSVQYRKALRVSGRGDITTEISMAPAFYYAEDYHQQYLAKNPRGYCGLQGTGVEYL